MGQSVDPTPTPASEDSPGPRLFANCNFVRFASFCTFVVALVVFAFLCMLFGSFVAGSKPEFQLPPCLDPAGLAWVPSGGCPFAATGNIELPTFDSGN